MTAVTGYAYLLAHRQHFKGDISPDNIHLGMLAHWYLSIWISNTFVQLDAIANGVCRFVLYIVHGTEVDCQKYQPEGTTTKPKVHAG